MALCVYWVSDPELEQDILDQMAGDGYRPATRRDGMDLSLFSERGPIFTEFTNDTFIYRVERDGRFSRCWLGGGVIFVPGAEVAPYYELVRGWVTTSSYWRNCGLLAASI